MRWRHSYDTAPDEGRRQAVQHTLTRWWLRASLLQRALLVSLVLHGALLTVLPGFDDPDQRGTEWRQEGTHWKGGERAQYLRNRRPRKDEEPDHE